MSQSNTADLQCFLDRLLAHSTLSHEEREAILGLPAKFVQVSGSRDHVRVRGVVDSCSILVSGMMSSCRVNARGLRQMTALHLPGDIANLHSLYRPVAAFNLEALVPSALLQVPHAGLRDIINEYPAIAQAFGRHLVFEMAITSQWLVNVSRKSARGRVAHLICEMAFRWGNGQPVHEFDLPLTQDHLGEATGLTSVHVNRVLRSLRNDGLVLCRSRRVQILNWPLLCCEAEFDESYLLANVRQAERLAA